MLNNIIVAIFMVFCILGCGVKGAPLPPLTPVPLGRGEPTYSEATKKDMQKKRTYKDQNVEESSKGGIGL